MNPFRLPVLKIGTLFVLVLSSVVGSKGAFAEPVTSGASTRPLTVMTQNLYFCYDFAPVFAATDPTSFIAASCGSQACDERNQYWSLGMSWSLWRTVPTRRATTLPPRP